VVGVARSGRQALAAIRELRPELVFLDIEMPGMSGFEVVQALQADDHLPVVVFVTAFDKYAVRAFDVNAVDYILKPLTLAGLSVRYFSAQGSSAASVERPNTRRDI
jgi:two-component system LytT family response regulator